MRLPRDGGEDHQVAGADQLLGPFIHGDLPGRAGLLQVAAEPGRAAGGQVVHADLVERPAGAGQEGVDVAGDQADPEESQRPPRPAAGALSQSAANAADAAVLVALMIELSRQANG